MAKSSGRQIRSRSLEFRSKLVEGVGAFIYAKSTGRYLFLLRNGGSWPMTWAVPGGKIIPGETPFEGLAREIEEELGGRIHDPKLILLDYYVSKNLKFRYTTYFVSVEDEFLPVLNNEHIGYAWLPLDTVPRPLHPGISRTLADKEILDKIQSVEAD